MTVRFKKVLKLLFLALIVSNLAACAKKKNTTEVNWSDFDDKTRFYGSQLTPEEEQRLISKRTFYFGLDRFDLEECDLMAVYAHANRLMCNSNIRVRIEGHTDERGSREYNIALGDRRAKAVANILLLKGVNQNQISIVSYGKERPAALGHDENAWRLNRRATIVYESE